MDDNQKSKFGRDNKKIAFLNRHLWIDALFRHNPISILQLLIPIPLGRLPFYNVLPTEVDQTEILEVGRLVGQTNLA